MSLSSRNKRGEDWVRGLSFGLSEVVSYGADGAAAHAARRANVTLTDLKHACVDAVILRQLRVAGVPSRSQVDREERRERRLGRAHDAAEVES